VLVGGVGGVQRCGGGSERRDREDQLHDLGPVRRDQRDPVAATHAERRELSGQQLDPVGERAVGDGIVPGREQGGALRRCLRDQRRERFAAHPTLARSRSAADSKRASSP
jgi:hypothetical protein